MYTNRPKEGSVAPVAVELALRGGQSRDTGSDRSLAGLADRQHGQAILVLCKTSFSTTSVTLLYTSQLLIVLLIHSVSGTLTTESIFRFPIQLLSCESLLTGEPSRATLI